MGTLKIVENEKKHRKTFELDREKLVCVPVATPRAPGLSNELPHD